MKGGSFASKYTDEETEETVFHGQCDISASPGAYFSTSGDEEWSCWSEETPAELRNDVHAIEAGFVGACNFGEWYMALGPEDAETCDRVPVDCSPGGSVFWSACHTALSDEWLCIQRPDQVKHEEEQELFKCDTVDATYEEGNAGTCGGGDFDSACFSLVPGVVWQCFPEHLQNELCSATPSSDGLYTGACVFETSELYDGAKDASAFQVREPSAFLEQSDEIWPWRRRAATTTAKWEKSTTTSTTSPRASSDEVSQSGASVMSPTLWPTRAQRSRWTPVAWASTARRLFRA